MLKEAHILAMIEGWDKLDSAIQNLQTALPHQLSERVNNLHRQRVDFRALFMGHMYAAHESLRAEKPASEAKRKVP